MRHSTAFFLPFATLLLHACFFGSKRDDDGDGGFTGFDGGNGDGNGDGSGDDTGGSGDGTGSDGGGGDDPSPYVDWGSSSLTAGSGVAESGWHFGIIESDSACGSDCWTGEDCVYGYYLSSSDTTLIYCHPLGSAGKETFQYGGSAMDLDEANDTVFPDSSFAGDCTYYFESPSGDCWIGGKAPEYYGGIGCTETNIPD